MQKGIIGVFILVLMGMAAGLPQNAFSATQAKDTAEYTLGEVVVTGQKPGVESIGTVREITSEEIARRHVRSLDEALELLPGLDIRTATDGVPRVDLRGFRSRHVLLLLNGIPFNSTFDGQFDPRIIPVENIAKIKVSYGNSSVLYGQGGLGGVINVITKKGTEGMQGSVKLETGTRSRNMGSFTLSGARNKFDGFVSGSIIHSDGFVLSDDFEATSEEDGGLRENSDRKSKNLFGNVGYELNDRWQIGVVANKVSGEFGKPAITINDKTDIFASSPKYVRTDDYDGFSGQISINGNLPGPFGVRGWLFTNKLDEEESRYDDANYNSRDKNNSYLQNNTTKIHGGTLQTSADLQTMGLVTLALSGEEQTFETNGFIQGKSSTERFDDDWSINIYSAAIEYEVSPFDRFGLVFGGSHHWFKDDSGDSDDGNGFLVGAHYDVFDSTRLRASVARKIRFPSIRQLYDAESGNTDLNPETSLNYEVGIDQQISPYTSLSLTGFSIKVKDYIEKIDATDRFENNDKYRFQGVELTASTRYFKNLLLQAGYTFMDTKDESPDTEKDELQYRPEHKLTLEAQYRFDFGLSAYASVMYLADQYFYSRTTPLEKEKLDNYTVVNCKLDQALLDNRLSLYLGVDNLFDKNYEEAYGYPRPGRTVYGGVTFRF